MGRESKTRHGVGAISDGADVGAQSPVYSLVDSSLVYIDLLYGLNAESKPHMYASH